VRPWAAYGAPPDAVAVAALIAAAALLLVGAWAMSRVFRAPTWLTVGLLALAAAGLSVAYVSHYLGGGPRIIDATSYWLEARALAEGHVTWPAPEPTASVRGRFLLMSGPEHAKHLGVIFPPGYPLVLALGFLIGAPLLVGPLLAACLVVATYALAIKVSGREDVARTAACLSVVCAALRCHTADTMSHGLAALLFAFALACAFAAQDAAAPRRRTAAALTAGLLFGWLVATRPLSSVALAPAIAAIVLALPTRARLALFAGAAVPIALFVLQQRAVTGELFASSQRAYYAVSDGPPECFRYGLGPGVGCMHEHGDFVRSFMPGGFGWRAGLMVSLRRLVAHALDIANAEPIAVLVVAAPLLAWRSRRIRLLSVTVAGLVALHAPFYFDGSYPGGGARFFADVLPLEHVLIAAALAAIAEKLAGRRHRWADMARTSSAVIAMALLGFGVHAVFGHVALHDREGGRPFYEPDVIAKAHVDRGLLFVGTDHAFNLAFDPDARDPSKHLVVARERGDDRDRLLWERLGRPAAHRYTFDATPGTWPAVVDWNPGADAHPYRFEAEAEWPPIAQSGGYFEPTWARGSCAWGGSLLTVRGVPGEGFSGMISFPVPRPGRYRIEVHMTSQGGSYARLALLAEPLGAPLALWVLDSTQDDLACSTLTPYDVKLTSDRGLIDLYGSGAGLSIDAIALEPTPERQ
jgi:hypothetical protein